MSVRGAALAFAVAAACAAAGDPLAEARQRDGWVTYAVPLAGQDAPCCFASWRNGERAGQRSCTLDKTQRNGFYGSFDDGKPRKRAPGPKPALQMFLLLERGEVERMLVVGSDCPVDAGRNAVHSLEGVTPAASAALLAELAGSRRDVDDEAWYALSLHAEVGIDALLAAARDKSRTPKARRQALFWLGASEDPRAAAEIESILKR